ncbi:polynucleotide adenylyltransferase region [Salisediminibacterium selenitireducens]|uniref:Polynucleotide adenylyltransferase region n=1 Tax=Bacillus selenitireducens (strain ATCC 700615 / DSM 15326 / MLS10) TaxID=439292 RepID=D6XUX2_BACIE|nr:polynucleotide adenylyltransferase region [Salisediminibacterium selenitireducens]ADH99608.1 Polynucleotide adenylyltransferase region [[Bacillus] selenitireducens MLS10]
MERWDKARFIQKKLTDQGFETYITGGAVRDLYLGRKASDIDLSTEAGPNQVIKAFERTKPIGIEFGTILVILEGEGFEVTTFRGTTITEDLACRDFTINAMALSNDWQLIDPFNGRQDLAKGLIQTVASAEGTLLDDPIRMIRSLRFALQFGFRESEDLIACIQRHADKIRRAAVERITGEFNKISMVTWTKEKSEYFIDHPALLPFIELFSHNRINTEIRSVGFPEKELNEIIWWVFAVYEEHDPGRVRQRLRTFKLSNKTVETAVSVCRMTDLFRKNGSWCAMDLYQAGETVLRYACLLLGYLMDEPPDTDRQITKYRELPITDKSELAVTGKDLIRLVPEIPKREYSYWLKELTALVVDRQIENDEAILITYVKEQIQNES